MPNPTWECPRCGQMLAESEASCRVCHVTRENRTVIGKIPTPSRAAKAPLDPVQVTYPFVLNEARFNLPLPSGSIWSSGWVVAVETGLYLLSAKDGLETATAPSAPPPAAGGPVGSLSLFVPKAQISRIVHTKLVGEFIEIQGKQKIPLRLPPDGWRDLDVLCGAMGIARP